MPHEFNEAASVHMNRDDSGVVRDLLHIEEPFVSRARTPQLAAREYLEKFGGLLGISADQLQNFGLHPEARPVEAKVEYRLLDEKTQFDTTTVIFSQTCFGLPVWEAAVAVHLQHDPLRVVSAQSTIQNVIADAEMMLGAARCYVFHAMNVNGHGSKTMSRPRFASAQTSVPPLVSVPGQAIVRPTSSVYRITVG